MPFFRNIDIEDGIIGVWKLTETPTELQALIKLSDSDWEALQKIKAEQRQAEFLATRLLLKKLISKPVTIEYSSSGKPFIPGSFQKLSISHSADFACVFISMKTIGIDIEQAERQIDRVVGRFLHPEEKEHISTLNNQQFAKILYWSAKEAIFKSSERQGISFKDQIRIEPFNPETVKNFTSRLIFPEKTFHYQLSFESFENNVMVYCVQQ